MKVILSSCACCLLFLSMGLYLFLTVGIILKYDHTNESCWAVLSCDAVYYAVQGGGTVWVCGCNPNVWSFKWKLLSSSFFLVLLITPRKVGVTSESVDQITEWNHWKESYEVKFWCGVVHCVLQGGSYFTVCWWNPKVWAVLSCGAVYYAVQGGGEIWVCGWNP